MIHTLLFSTLYPSSVRPSHGIFVETRLRHLLAGGKVERVVAPRRATKCAGFVLVQSIRWWYQPII